MKYHDALIVFRIRIKKPNLDINFDGALFMIFLILDIDMTSLIVS